MSIVIDKNYIILCGYFNYDQKYLNCKTFKDNYKPWHERLGVDKIDGYYRFLSTYYYPTFLNVAFPENSSQSLSNNCNHFTLNMESKPDYKVADKNGRFSCFNLDYVDIYFFPENIGIFAIKTILQPKGDSVVTAEELSDYLYLIRNETSSILSGDKIMGTVFSFINTAILLSSNLQNMWFLGADKPLHNGNSHNLSCNNKLKTYCIIESDLDVTTKEGKQKESELLFELGTGARIGTIEENGDFAPSRTYFEKIVENNNISIFNNWSALSLFDTFTVLINKKQNGAFTTFNNFENTYFSIYIHAIFLKYVLYTLNTSIARLQINDNRNRYLRDTFIGIKNNFFFSHISYNFMPNDIYHHLIESLEINTEIEQMEQRIEKINDFVEEQSTKAVNHFLAFMALIAPFSALWDLAEWLSKIFGIERDYSLFSFILFILLFVTPVSVIITSTIRRKKHKRH